MKLKNLVGLVLIVTLLAMFGCGGGGSSSPAPTAVVKIATTGTGATPVGSVNAMLNYSSSKYSLPPNNATDGFNPKVIASANGIAANTFVFGRLSSAGHVRIGLISTGITGGEFATATFTILPGKTAAPGDFTIALPFATDEGVTDVDSLQIVGSSVTATRQP